ncbi:hypothetical protein UFOVP1301_46 [uncultured Caudovirales phage]|uniref:Uncharacterized protein n=1 Tax=uncultured Caudovirales phage TaxID=2100421 RepID=A0A6J5PGH2_9CAUD|nr:hypothetical protein UFOVP663_31 [uncultured Caudovirales phage]CAB4168611.1 hypothetical protein UFOVP894_7 [uncultured Caudovirales phage]CAB4181202.1 hypothetical protein UFOVP1069_21 [uncultured Caudovirales phage]CAB4195966.1 hypothetical protein UFOVP1301_46 [uncultured Caudovirales phage]CAB4211032.1 hypothetical protein UFOVP1415_68 [uncultured Caudovirales phage]
MSEASKAARSAMKKKIANMVAGDPRQKVDASSWTPPEMMNTSAKTGLRPISRRAFKKGGKVVACMGEDAKQNAGKKPRKAGGGEASKYANAKVNRNVKEANAELGKPHTGGYRKGGRTHKDMGGPMVDPRLNMVSPGRLNFDKNLVTPGRKDGGKADASQDKKLIKKAFRQHETAEHGGKHVPLHLRKGGKIHKDDGGDVDDKPKRTNAPENVYKPSYNEDAVNASIASSNRSGRKISGKGSKAIHALLKGRYQSGGDVIMTEPKPAPMPTQEQADLYKAMEAAKAEAEAAREAARKAREGKKHGGRTHKAMGGNSDDDGMNERGAGVRYVGKPEETFDFSRGKASPMPVSTKTRKIPTLTDDDDVVVNPQRKASNPVMRAAPPSPKQRAESYRKYREKKPFQQKELSLRDKLMNAIQGVDDDHYAKGGKIKPNYEGGTRPTGGRLAKAYGGGLMEELAGAKSTGAKSKSKGKKSKGKTDITINISTAPKPDAMMPPKPPMMPPPGPPMLPPGPPPGAPPGMMPPPGGPMGMPPGGPPMPPPGMMGRKAGGRVGHRTYRSYKDMDAGSGGGLGRLEKTEIQEHKAGRKEGGRVGHRTYRSYKDMDAGSGGGLGRLEKTEIQEHKRK